MAAWSVTVSVQIVSVADRPQLWMVAYRQVALPTLSDLQTPCRVEVLPSDWAANWITDPSAMFLALADNMVVGVSGLLVEAGRQDRAKVGATAVRRRPWRGRSIAAALKRDAQAWAAGRRVAELST